MAIPHNLIEPPPAYKLYNLYYVQKMSTPQMAKHLGVSKGTIYNWMKMHNLECRENGEGVTIAQTGKRHSEERKAAIGRGNKGREQPWMWGKKNPIFRNGNKGSWAKGGKREDIGIYVRSSWEANYCRYLLFLKSKGAIHDWKYEPDVFYFEGIRRGCVSYTPDFKVWRIPGEFEYHEIKGYAHKKGETALKRMAKYHPDVKIILIDKAAYREIARQVAGFIPYWE